MNKTNWNLILRKVHRYVGFLMVGVFLVYGISGIVLLYRNTDLLKRPVTTTQNLDPKLSPEALGSALRLKNFKVTATSPDTLYFAEGYYLTQTGVAQVTIQESVPPIAQMIRMHKMVSSNPTHYFALLVGIGLLLLVVTSFWMFKAGTAPFKQGMLFVGIGCAITLLILFLV
ncbi:MAG: hypothetical protein PHV49_06125 [Alistipes sp.]|nr:hypothetical protein [Alistipes sp.]